MIVRELITKLGFSFSPSQLNNAEKGLDKLTSKAESAASYFKNIALSIASFATVKSIINVADEMQNMRSRVGMLPQTIGDAGAALDEIGNRASKSGMSIKAYGALYSRVGNAAKDYIKTQEDLLGITDTISKALVVGGASAQEASAVMLQFSQALASGVLQGDEFRSMAEAAPQYLDKLSESLNIPREKLKKMASEGKLTSKEVLEATRKMSGYFSEKFKEMPMTVGRAITIIGNRFSLFIDKINRKSLFITRLADDFLFAFDKIENGIRIVVNALGGLDNAIRFVGTAIVVAFGAKALQILASFRIASLAALLPFIKMAAIILIATFLIEDLYVWVKGGDSLIGSFAGKWDNVKDSVLRTAESVAVLAGIFLAWKVVSAGVTFAINAYKIALIGLMAIKRGLIAVTFALNMVMALNPIGLVVLAVLALISAGALLILKWDTVKKWFSDFFGWFGEKFSELGKWVSDLLGKAGALFGISGGDINTKSTTTTIGAKPIVGPQDFKSQGMGLGYNKPSVQSNTTVNVTVPPGTTAEQANFLKSTAQKEFANSVDSGLARNLAIYAP